jgi:hypothetical protein
MTDQPTPIPTPTPIKLAFILDGRVQEMLNTDSRLAAIFLSEPIIVDISGKQIKLQSSYNPDNGEFTDPVFDQDGNLIG